MCRPDGRHVLNNQGTDDYVLTFNQMVLQCCKYVMDEEERNAEIKETGDLHE